jgi:hypothetical protein
MSAHTLSGVAHSAAACFEFASRASGEEGWGSRFVRLRKGSPDWIKETVREAHEGGEILPDDWTYAIAREAFEAIGDAGEGIDLDELASEFSDGADVYTADLLKWMESYPHSVQCCDEARDELGDPEDTAKMMAYGQYIARGRIYGAVLEGVRAQLEALIEQEEEDAEQAGEGEQA